MGQAALIVPSVDAGYATFRVPVFFTRRATRDLERFRSQFEGSPAVGALDVAILNGFPVPAAGPRRADVAGERVRQRRNRKLEWYVLHPSLVVPDHLLSDDDLLGDDELDPIRPLGSCLLGLYKRLGRDTPIDNHFECSEVSEFHKNRGGDYNPGDL